MSNFLQRTITGILFVLVLISAVYFHFFSFLFLFALIIILSQLEFYKIVKTDEVKPQKISGIITGLILFATFSWAHYSNQYYILLINLPVIFTIFIFELFRKSKNPFMNIAYTILGILYIALPVSLLTFIVIAHNGEYNPALLLGYFFLLWSYDTGAYLIGRLAGKNKLFERISPKKTWEGAVGGLIISVGIAYILNIYFPLLTFTQWAAVAVIIAITGTFGDLIESMLKRSSDLKDSGNILPGHGGILDRFDALFISVPFVITYLYLIVSYNLDINFF